MSEFSSRVDAQRQLLKVVNDGMSNKEELFALNAKAISRWSATNKIDPSSKLVGLLNAASARIFVMASLSDDPIAGDYLLKQAEVTAIGDELAKALSN